MNYEEFFKMLIATMQDTAAPLGMRVNAAKLVIELLETKRVR